MCSGRLLIRAYEILLLVRLHNRFALTMAMEKCDNKIKATTTTISKRQNENDNKNNVLSIACEQTT